MVVNIWTHIVITYSSANGLALYTNGTLRSLTDPFTSFSSSVTDYSTQPYMMVGNRKIDSTTASCTTGTTVSAAAYRGLIDELRVYSRELTSNEICSLFNP
jgi:hypothetical protein